MVIWRFKCGYCGNYDCNENESGKHMERMWISSGDMEIKGIKNKRRKEGSEKGNFGILFFS